MPLSTAPMPRHESSQERSAESTGKSAFYTRSLEGGARRPPLAVCETTINHQNATVADRPAIESCRARRLQRLDDHRAARPETEGAAFAVEASPSPAPQRRSKKEKNEKRMVKSTDSSRLVANGK